MKALQVVWVVILVVSWSGYVDYSRGSSASRLNPSLKVTEDPRTCIAVFDKIAPCVLVNYTRCQTSESMLQPCMMWLRDPNGPQPSQNCCSALVSAEKLYPTCFCLVTFYHRPPLNRSILLQAARVCNVTTDLCEQCPPLLTALPTGQASSTLNPVCGTVVQDRHDYKKIKALAWSLSVGGGILLGLSLFCLLAVCRRHHPSSPQLIQEQEEIERIEGRPTIFPYSVLRTATRKFHYANKLGEGGFGEVFKGVLPDGMEVAVKRLVTRSRQGKHEFLNEVTLITSVQHRNLVKLKGCCLKDNERLLVYEFLENRSLYDALFDPMYPIYLDWPSRVKIAVGTACGLAYLHEGCETRIIHRDVKSSNILLTRDLEPKISDFGLAKLVQDTQNHISTRVAGTVGYLSPEYALRGQLTEKADVFSYGIVLLELLSGRTNLDQRLPSDRAYILDWVWQLHDDDRLLDILDPRLKNSRAADFEEEVYRLATISLLCTQVATRRPSMTCVVSMLTGETAAVSPRLVKPSLRYFEGLKEYSGPYRTPSWKKESAEASVFKSSTGSCIKDYSGPYRTPSWKKDPAEVSVFKPSAGPSNREYSGPYRIPSWKKDSAEAAILNPA